ncbi:cation:proton antiporter [Cellulosimicrobium cellulans]|uniref:cation:proton antiporter n=1 Tax=Cellulosimicrobium cellulans TaxID=1710 RepID=UPI0027DE73C3|nr:cation:proton antiporter [Cellulosimicrobium cellulans]
MSTEMLLVVISAVVLVVVVTVLARKVGVAGPLLLVGIGVAVSYVPAIPPISVEPNLILVGVLPPLLYSAAVAAPRIEFRRDSTAIGGLAVVLVIVSALVLGVFFAWAVPGLGLGLGIALGAILSPTDAVATSIVKEQGAPRRVLAVLEGESLLNDATALVTLRTAIAAAAVGFSVLGTAGSFAWAVTSAVVVGGGVGAIALRVRSWTRSATANTALGLTVPYLAYLPTEALGGSGVVAAVAAGIVCGRGATRWLTPEQRISDKLNWRTVEFVLEGAVFLAMGLELYGIVSHGDADGADLMAALWIAPVALVILTGIRAAYVFPMLGLHNGRVRRSVDRRLAARERALRDGEERPRARGVLGERGSVSAPESIRRLRNDIDYYEAAPLTWKDSTIVVWAGMRGVVTLAAAQTLPEQTPARDLLVFIAFVVAAGSLMLQGLTLPALVRRLSGPTTDSATPEDVRLIHADLHETAERAVARRTVARPDATAFPPELYETSRPWFFEVGRARQDAGPDALRFELALVGIMRERLRRLTSSGQYDSGAAQYVFDELDAYEITLRLHLAGGG